MVGISMFVDIVETFLNYAIQVNLGIKIEF